MKTYKNFIGGKWISFYSKKVFHSLNPTTEHSIIIATNYKRHKEVDYYVR